MPFSKVTLPIRTESQLSAYLRSPDPDGGVFLLHGTSDHNRLRTAEALARYYLCTGTQDPSCPCPSCRAFNGGEHPDFFSMELSAAGNLLVGTVREALDFASEMSTVSDRRCLLIGSADKLTTIAEGSLLKVLEEDPEGVLVIMTCRDRRSIPRTLMSRAKLFFTGDASARTYQSVLMGGGLKAAKAEELSKLSPYLSVDPFISGDVVVKAHEAGPSILLHILKGDTCKALGKYSSFSNLKLLSGDRILAEVMVALCTDILKVKFKSPLHVSMPGRVSWYLEKSDSFLESDVNRCLNAFSKVLSTPDDQVRSMFIWAVGIVSLLVRADLEKERKAHGA